MTRLWCAFVLLVSGTPLAAQNHRLEFSGGMLAMSVLQGDETRFGVRSGTWIGLEGSVRRGKLSLGIRGLTGNLTGDSAGIADQKGRLTAVSLRLHPSNWVSLGVEAEALRTEVNSVGTVWRLIGVGVTVSGGLGIPGLRGRADVAAFPVASAAPSDQFGTPVRMEVGLLHSFTRTPVDVQVAYRLDLITFDASRSQRFGGLLLGVVVRW